MDVTGNSAGDLGVAKTERDISLPDTPPQVAPEVGIRAQRQGSEDRGALAAKLNISFSQLSAERAVGHMPVSGNTQVFGALHGGATAALCENVASAASQEHARTRGLAAVGTELTISHLRPAFAGSIKAVAEAVLLGKSRCVHRLQVKDDQDRIIATALVTNLLVEPY